MTVQLFCGDCLEILPELETESVDAVITDPPYGGNYDTNHKRFTNAASPQTHRTFDSIVGDDKPFDPSIWLSFPKAVLFGFNVYSDKLPPGTLLIWQKRRDSKLGVFLSDCEVAWMKGSKGVYLFKHEWDGFMKESERGEKRLHPTQKPFAVMRWIIERAGVLPGETVIDPYMGIGTTGVACIQAGINFIGIEVVPDYFTIAQQRIADAQQQLRLL